MDLWGDLMIAAADGSYVKWVDSSRDKIAKEIQDSLKDVFSATKQYSTVDSAIFQQSVNL